MIALLEDFEKKNTLRYAGLTHKGNALKIVKNVEENP